MTTRLYCRECGWHLVFPRKRSARRAAARHQCATAALAETMPRRRPWPRLWTHLFGTSSTTITGITTGDHTDQARDSATEFVDACGNRIQWAVLAAHHAETTRRARRAMVDLVRAGYQIGRPPYGYRALRIRVTDPTGHSKLRAVLVPDWHTAAVVKQIFTWRTDHRLGIATIAAQLNSDPSRYPPPTQSGRWTVQAVRRIVTNPKYTGRQVWARTVAGRPAPIEQWVTSARRVHEPLVDARTFHHAQPGSTEANDSPRAA